MPVITETMEVTIATPALGPSFWRGAFGDVNMDVAFFQQGRANAKRYGTCLDVAFGSLHRLAHHIAELAGDGDFAFTRQRHSFDRQQFAADFRPGQAGGHADQIFGFDFAEAEFFNAGVFFQIAARDVNRWQAFHQNVLD